MKIIRETQSACPLCLQSLHSFIVECEDKVFLLKRCPEHGEFRVVLSRSAGFYGRLDRFFFDIMSGTDKLCEYELWVTLRCNANCAICHLGEETKNHPAEPSLLEIEDFIKNHNASSYILSGGEPTCRNDLDEIIKIFKRYRKTVTMHTNGIKLGDVQYVKKLYEAGIDRINLQFDGFERQPYKVFRCRDELDTKLKVLENLKSVGMPTDLNVTIARNINEDQVGPIVDFAVKNNFINAVSFFTICYLAAVKDWPLENYIMPDEVADILELQTAHKITKKNIFLFQKLHLAIKSWLHERFCLYSAIYVVYRKNGGYEPIDKYLNLSRAEYWLERYRKIYGRNKILSGLLLITMVPLALFKPRSIIIIKELFMVFASFLFKNSYHQKSKKLLFINFNTACDPYKIDYEILKNCHDEIVKLNAGSRKMENCGRDGLRAFELERKRLACRHT